jgi:hypothetical protein
MLVLVVGQHQTERPLSSYLHLRTPVVASRNLSNRCKVRADSESPKLAKPRATLLTFGGREEEYFTNSDVLKQ